MSNLLPLQLESDLINAQWSKYQSSPSVQLRRQWAPSVRPKKYLDIPAQSQYIGPARLEYFELEIPGLLNSDGDASLKQKNVVLKYTFSKPQTISPPDGWPLYIVFHGGGGPVNGTDPTDQNNVSWYNMKNLYEQSVGSNGIYVAVRGIPVRYVQNATNPLQDEWDLHFTNPGYQLLDKLIETLILFEGVDSNRVYMIGFSAGGDAIYRHTARLSQRLAATNMGAGDPGDTSFVNYMNVPICLQCGESDNLYERSKKTALAGKQLKSLDDNYPDTNDQVSKNYFAKSDPPIYRYDVYLHPTPGPILSGLGEVMWRHNSWETSTSLQKGSAEIVDDWEKWLRDYKPKSYNTASRRDQKSGLTTYEPTITANTNAVQWTSYHVRDTVPTTVVWDLTTTFPNCPKQSYWLDIDDKKTTDFGKLISAWVDQEQNVITVLSAKGYLRLLLRSDLVDYMRPITVRMPGQTFDNGSDSITVTARLDPYLIQQTCNRNDRNLIYSAAITLRQTTKGGVWQTPIQDTWPATAAVATDSNRIDVFGLAPDDGIYYHKWFENGAWKVDWDSLGKQKFLTPPSACSDGVGRMTVVGVGIDGKCYFRRWISGWRNEWTSLDGRFVTPVTVVADPTARDDYNIHVFGIDTDGVCQHRAIKWIDRPAGSIAMGAPGQAPSPWQITLGYWEGLGVAPTSAPLRGPVSAIYVDSGVHVWCLDRNNQGNYLAKITKNTLTIQWSSWSNVDGSFTGPPSLVSCDGIRIDCYFIDTEGMLWHVSYPGSGVDWKEWSAMRGGFKGVPSATVLKGISPRNDVYCLTSDGTVTWFLSDTKQFTHSYTLKGNQIASSPVAVSGSSQRMDIIALDFATNSKMRHAWWQNSAPWWLPTDDWEVVGGERSFGFGLGTGPMMPSWAPPKPKL